MTRAEKVERAEELRAEGLTMREIAAEMGISWQSVSSYLNDPDLAKQNARRARYAGTCKTCGAKTDGSNGKVGAPERCQSCRSVFQHENRIWTRERIIDAIRRFASEHGRPPIADEWRSGGAERGYPPTSAVYVTANRPLNPFASWADAIEAAGFPRPTSGHYQVNPRPGDREAAA